MKKTKIVCTLGPASESEDVMSEMLMCGMNVARFNFSHGTHEYHKELMDRFKRVRDKLGIPAAIMLDTKGPEIRLGCFENGRVTLEDGAKFTLTTEDVPGSAERVSVSYPQLPQKLSRGNRILIDDGRITLTVQRRTSTELQCIVEKGGEVSDHKGVNIPSVSIGMPYLSERDTADLLFGIENEVDFVAASFARSREDIELLRSFLRRNGGEKIRIIAKIENFEGIQNFDSILEASDGIMVARGDMGVEVNYECLPGLQKKFIKRCYQAGKMVITATQMLESMINNPTPTRAEISDVANAIFDGTSAIMLSAESAAGLYPVRTVEVMSRIAEKAEADAIEQDCDTYHNVRHDMDYSDITNAVSDAARTTALDIHAKAIVVVTKSGNSARKVSKFRPTTPIIAATPELKTYHQLSLSWGVYPVLSKYCATTDELFSNAVECAKKTGIVGDGDRVVITSGAQVGEAGGTNMMTVQTIGEN